MCLLLGCWRLLKILSMDHSRNRLQWNSKTDLTENNPDIHAEPSVKLPTLAKG